MSKIICAKSGLKFSCEYMPTTLVSSSFSHPLFSVDQHKLISLAGQWAAQKLGKVESYLLFLALLNSTTLIDWRCQAQYHEGMDSIVENNMETLLEIISKLEIVKSPTLTLPSFSINPSTNTLDNVNHWIACWQENYRDWYEGNQADELREKLSVREEALQRLLKSSTPPSTYAKVLADWAATAGAFPTFTITHPISSKPITIADYWKQIICTIANEDKLWRYPRKDIAELITHCEDHIQHGSIYAHSLMKYIKGGMLSYDDYLGFGDAPTPTTPTKFTVMSSNPTTQEINKSVLINTAPTEEPKKHQYPTTSAWLKAYTRWRLAKVSSPPSPAQPKDIS